MTACEPAILPRLSIRSAILPLSSIRPTGVNTGVDGRLCTQFGLPSPMAMINLSRLNMDLASGSSTSTIGALRQAIRDGRDSVSMTHAAPAFNPTLFGQVLDFVKARMEAGEIDVMSLPEWYARIAARSGVA